MEEIDGEIQGSRPFIRAHVMLAHGMLTTLRDSGREYDKKALDHYETILALFEAREKSALYTLDKLLAVKAAAETDVSTWAIERNTLHDALRTVATVVASAPSPSSAVAATVEESEEEKDDRAFEPTTLLSVAGRAVLDARKAALNPDDTQASRYEERLESSFAAFLEVIGDKPLSYYLPIHMQDFATVLARVPTNRSKHPIFSGLTLKQMGEKNAKLPPDQRKKCLSETTIASYLSEVKNIWTRATAGVHGLRDIGALKVTMPKGTEEAIDREPLVVSSLNIWIRAAATPKLMRKPHKAWLPLVGLLTGMRLAELIFLQKTDIVNVEGNEVIDLRRPLLIGGQAIDRPVKTKTSKRIVAIHPLLRECGFIDYAKSGRAGGFVFGPFHNADDPADAAQKQMGTWMQTLGIHVTQRQVFHSLRHNAKHWFRDKVGERAADLQCGHALTSVSKKYGHKCLAPEEVQKIMAIPAPKEIDFSPFLSR